MASYSSSENKYYAIISMSYLFLSCTKPQPIKNPYQYSFPVTPKDKFTAKKRAKIEAKVRKGMQDYSKEKRTNPYIDMFGSLTEQDLRSSLESEYLQKKEKLANSRVSNR